MDILEDIKRLKESGISRTKAAEALGMPRFKLEEILEVVGIDWPKQGGPTYDIDGVTRTIQAHANKLGLPASTIRQRLKDGRDPTAPSAIVPITPDEANTYAELRKAGVGAWEAARQVGRPYNSLKNAARRHVPDYEEIADSAPRSRRSAQEEAHAFADLRKAGLSASEAARQLGRPYHSLKNAARRYVPDYDQITASTPRGRRSTEEIGLAS